MIALPEMLLKPAQEAGIKVPSEDADFDNFNVEEYPHFHLFCCAQLGQPMPTPTAHWENAKVIALIPADKVKAITFGELQTMGFQIGYSSAWA